MISGRNSAAGRYLLTLFHVGTVGDLTDGQLLERFVSGGGEPAEAAFQALVDRHGPMVLRVCRRVLGDPHDAEDAFQATFLILVQKAGAVRKSESVASWLHGVALRVASDARASAMRRRKHEARGAELAAGSARGRPAACDESPDLGRILEEEVGRLPEKYGTPVVLCHLEGLTHEEAAERLGWPVGTVRSRLSRGRDRLRSRLLRRGLAPAAMLPAVASGDPARAAAAGLVDQTVKAAARIVAGEAMSAGMVPASVASMIRKALRSMFLNKLKTAAAATLALGILTAGAFALAMPRPRDDLPKAAEAVADDAKKAAPLPTRAEVRNALKNWWDRLETLEFRELDTYLGPDGRPNPGWATHFIDYAHAPGNRRAVRHGSINAEGAETLIQERRFDGKTQTYIGADGKYPPEITFVEVFDQTDTRDHYEGEHGAITGQVLMWIGGPDSPGARPFYTYIDGGAPLAISRDAGGKPRVVLTLGRHGAEYRFELDPEHDFLPRDVEGRSIRLFVTKFARVGGVWFPVEGSAGVRIKDREHRFKVVDLKVNRPIPDSRFTMPPELEARAVFMGRPRLDR